MRTTAGQCSAPPTIQNGYIVSSTFNSAVYECDIGYQFSSSNLNSASCNCEAVIIQDFMCYWTIPPRCRGMNIIIGKKFH